MDFSNPRHISVMFIAAQKSKKQSFILKKQASNTISSTN